MSGSDDPQWIAPERREETKWSIVHDGPTGDERRRVRLPVLYDRSVDSKSWKTSMVQRS